MASLSIKDLSCNNILDQKSMACISGGAAPWVFGWIRPYEMHTGPGGTVMNFYQINNYAEQMINQVQFVDVRNSGNNANIQVALEEHSSNVKR